MGRSAEDRGLIKSRSLRRRSPSVFCFCPVSVLSCFHASAFQSRSLSGLLMLDGAKRGAKTLGSRSRRFRAYAYVIRTHARTHEKRGVQDLPVGEGWDGVGWEGDPLKLEREERPEQTRQFSSVEFGCPSRSRFFGFAAASEDRSYDSDAIRREHVNTREWFSGEPCGRTLCGHTRASGRSSVAPVRSNQLANPDRPRDCNNCGKRAVSFNQARFVRFLTRVRFASENFRDVLSVFLKAAGQSGDVIV